MSLWSGHSPSLQCTVKDPSSMIFRAHLYLTPPGTWDYQPGQMLVQPKRKHCGSHIHWQGVSLAWAQLLSLWNLSALQWFLGVSGMAGKTCTSQLWDNHPCSFSTKEKPNTDVSSLQLPTRSTVPGYVSVPPCILVCRIQPWHLQSCL